MLRLPATSISLSENDLTFHLEQINIYHGLLRQGFQKHDIVRYLKEHNAGASRSSPDYEYDNLRAPSTADLAFKTFEQPVAHVSPHFVEDPMSSSSQSDESGVADEAEEQNASPLKEQSSPLDAPASHADRHAPRQSSMLRYAQAASPDRLMDRPIIAIEQHSPSARTYRPRSNTYPYSQSEVSDSDRPYDFADASPECNAAVEVHRSAMRPEAEVFIPSGNHSPISRHILEPFEIYEDPGLAASPPRTPAGVEETTLLPVNPRTPARSHQAGSTSRTDPRSQQLDGSFSVYNDALPSSSQPQTPADLGRNAALRIGNAAYTAPPGMIHLPTRFLRHHTSSSDEPGLQTPTARAIGMRERRTRELLRSIRTETSRRGRMRLEDQNTTERITEDAEDAEAEEEVNTTVHGWQDTFEGDRVGDENWETEMTVNDNMERGIRIVSGNTRVLR